MQEIIDLERRITAALERIAKSAMHPARRTDAADEEGVFGENGDLAEILDEERMANAQLQERLRVLSERESVQAQRTENEISEIKVAHAAEVRSLNALVESMSKEMKALRAERQAEAEQITDIVAALTPIIEEARHA